MFKITLFRGSPSIEVKVSPGSPENKILGVWNEGLRVKVKAPPEKGKANEELCRFLAKEMGIRKSDLSIVQGETSPNKRIAFLGLSAEQVEEKVTGVLKKI